MDDVTKRLNVFDHQFLRAADFQVQLAYDRDRRQRILSGLFTPGVVEGLTVAVSSAGGSLTISPGTAIDANGNEIVLLAAQTVSPLPADNNSAMLYIAYSEAPSDPSTDPGITGNTRITETPQLALVPPQTQPANAILLAKVSADGTGKITIDTSNALLSGALRLNPNEILPVASLFANTSVGVGTSNPYTQLEVRKDAAGALGPSITLINGAGSAGAGGSLDFDGYDPGAGNPPAARIQSLDDGNFSAHLAFLSKQQGGAAKPLTEWMRVTSTGSVGVGTQAPHSSLEVQGSGATAAVTLTNATGGAGAVAALDFNTFLPLSTGTYNPSARIAAIDDGGWLNDIVFMMNKPGGANKTLVENLRITSDGHIKSPMWNVTQVFNEHAGPVPATGISGPFTSGGGKLLIFASGSGFAIPPSGGMIGIQVLIDGAVQGAAQSFTNEVNSHKSFVANALVISGIAAGSHTLAVLPAAGTTIDQNDRISVTVLELPIS